MVDYLKQSIEDIHRQLKTGEISSAELTKETIERAKAANQSLNAFITFDEQAVQKAEQVKISDNLFSGLPYALKDNILTNQLRTTAGSKMLENFIPIYDATVTQKINQTGAINIGKLNMDEFAMGGTTETSYFGVTKNPWNTDLVPGGSSGGSAAAIAAGLVPLSLGTDTGGSIRQPAAFNGIVGMKPTYGRVSRYGVIAFSSSLDQVGPMTRRVKDNALLLNTIAGYDSHDNTSVPNKDIDFTAKIGQSIKGLKIGVPSQYFAEGVNPQVASIVKSAIQKLADQGAIVEEVSLPHSQYGVSIYFVIATAEASSNLQRFDGVRYGFSDRSGSSLEEMYLNTRTEGFGNEVKRRLMLGTFALSSDFYDAYFKKAAQVRTLIIDDFSKVFQDFDLIIAPTAPTAAFKIGEEITDSKTRYMNDLLTIPVNMAGLPAVSINAGFNSDNLPVGMQLIGKPFDEATLYQVASVYEELDQLYKTVPEVK